MLTKALATAALSLLLGLSAEAHGIEIGAGIFCDTQKEVERFLALFDGDAAATMNTVNTEAKDPTACGYAYIALVRGPHVVTANTWREARVPRNGHRRRHR
jgi:hypothetical protein